MKEDGHISAANRDGANAAVCKGKKTIEPPGAIATQAADKEKQAC